MSTAVPCVCADWRAGGDPLNRRQQFRHPSPREADADGAGGPGSEPDQTAPVAAGGVGCGGGWALLGGWGCLVAADVRGRRACTGCHMHTRCQYCCCCRSYVPVQRREEVAFCQKQQGIVLEAYSPLAKAQKLGDPVVGGIAQRLGVSPAQVLIRWSVQKGFVPLPKSTHPDRQRSNLDVFRCAAQL